MPGYIEPVRAIVGYASEILNGARSIELDKKFLDLPLKGVVIGDSFGSTVYEFFEHGTNANAIRPATNRVVVWVGSVSPTQWIEGDIYLNSTLVGGGPPALPSMPTGLAARWSGLDVVQSDGATVTAWNDRVASRTLTLAGGTPIFVAADKAVRFDGVDDYMEATLSLAQPQTTIVLTRLPGSVNSMAIVGSGTAIHSISTSSAGVVQLNAGTSLASAFTMVPNAWAYIAAAVNGASSGILVNQGSPTTGNAGSNARATVRVGANTAATAFGRVDIKEILVFNRALSASEISDVRTLLNSDHGLAL